MFSALWLWSTYCICVLIYLVCSAPLNFAQCHSPFSFVGNSSSSSVLGNMVADWNKYLITNLIGCSEPGFVDFFIIIILHVLS